MRKAKKISVSLNEEILEKGKALAEKRGIPSFSAFVSVLIAEESNRKERGKN